jgi:phosphate transport system substrate-binding protein
MIYAFVMPAVIALGLAITPAAATEATGAGSTSGGGIAQIKAATVDFGASDMPMKPEDPAKLGMGQFPLVIGGVVPIINLEGVQPGQMRFTGPLLADIFLGKVKAWNDPAIQKLNPDLTLPDIAITVVHRSDGSGTTFNWTNYLSAVSPEWKEKVGEGTAIHWPTGLGGRGNEGVAGFAAQTKGAIGYVEYAYVLQDRMTYALVQNKAGQFVKPDAEGFQAAAASADWPNAKDFHLIMTDAPGEKAYPITATVFIMMYKKAKNPERAKVAMDFFAWAMHSGQQLAETLSYVPLPDDLVQQIETYWKTQFGMRS